METRKYKRVLIKISGEALAGDKHFGLNFDGSDRYAMSLKNAMRLGARSA